MGTVTVNDKIARLVALVEKDEQTIVRLRETGGNARTVLAVKQGIVMKKETIAKLQNA